MTKFNFGLFLNSFYLTAQGDLQQKRSERDEFMQQNGIEILHFENRWVYEYPQDIIDAIQKIKKRKEK